MEIEMVMADAIKSEVTVPGEEDCQPTALRYELTTTKTEVKEELCDFQTIDNVDCDNVETKYSESAQLPDEYVEVFICSVCNVGILEEDFYKEHVESCSAGDLRLNEKEEIPAEETLRKKARKHYVAKQRCNSPGLTSAHGGKGRFACKMCQKSFVTIRDRKRHVRTHVPKRDCRHCDSKFHDRNSLLRHVREKHSLWKCDICSYKASYRCRLNTHMAAKHNDGETKYKCASCPFVTCHRRPMVDHVREHVKEKLHRCKFKYCSCARPPGSPRKEPCGCRTCDYITGRKTRLRKHMLTRHGVRMKKHKCLNCKYSTNFKDKLMNHMRLHVSEQPFECKFLKTEGPYKQENEENSEKPNAVGRNEISGELDESKDQICDYKPPVVEDLQVRIRRAFAQLVFSQGSNLSTNIN